MARKKNRQTLAKTKGTGSSKGPKKSGKGRAKPAKSRSRGRGRARRVGRTGVAGGGSKKKYAGSAGTKTRKR